MSFCANMCLAISLKLKITKSKYISLGFFLSYKSRNFQHPFQPGVHSWRAVCYYNPSLLKELFFFCFLGEGSQFSELTPKSVWEIANKHILDFLERESLAPPYNWIQQGKQISAVEWDSQCTAQNVRYVHVDYWPTLWSSNVWVDSFSHLQAEKGWFALPLL